MMPLCLKSLKKMIPLALLVIGLFATGCQSNISQLLQATLPASNTSLVTPTQAATAPPLTVPPDLQTVIDVPPTETPNVPVEPTQEETSVSPTPNATQNAISGANTSNPLPTFPPNPTLIPPAGPVYYVSTGGNDWSGTGSVDLPWATIGRALQGVEDGATIMVGPGTYSGQLALERKFPQGVTIQSEEAYQAQLRHHETVVICYYCQGITLAGFDIAHTGAGADRYVIQIQDLEGDQSGGRRVTLRNNIIHDSRNNDLLKVNNGADDIIIEGNIFYNMGGPGLDSLIDVNSATNVIIQDNVFFNDFKASNRSRDNDTGSFVVIKDSNGAEDSNLGSKAVTVRRNVFLNWQGDPNNAFLVIGEDNVDYFQAENVLIENNLMLGNAKNPMRAAIHIRGSRDIIFRNNTVTGDLPSRSYAMRLSRADKNPSNENIYFHNNIWSDPTGTMGVFKKSNGDLFAEAQPSSAKAVDLRNNLYWNDEEHIPWDDNQLVNYTDDPQRILANPWLPDLGDITTPDWLAEEGRFADGSMTIRDVFESLVFAYGRPVQGGGALNAAEPELSATEDILARPRTDGAPDVGAYETGS
jgi:hypothetical protein